MEQPRGLKKLGRRVALPQGTVRNAARETVTTGLGREGLAFCASAKKILSSESSPNSQGRKALVLKKKQKKLSSG